MVDSRLEFAKSIGADEILKVGRDVDASVAEVERLMGRKPDVTIECSGIQSSTHLAIKVSLPLIKN